MRSFFVKFLGSIVFMFILWVALIAFESGNPTLMSQWVYDVYSKKIKIVNSIKAKKIVIVAGSNALFGINSNMLSKSFHLPVVNFGVNAGVELPLTLYLAKRVINRGDIVILPLEYSMYCYDGRAGVQMIDYILSREPSFFWKLGIKEQLYILWHISMSRVYNGYFYRGGEKILSGVYRVGHIDNRGDEIETSPRYKTKDMYIEIDKYAKNGEKYGQKFNIDGIWRDYIKNFLEWSDKNGVEIIFMPSTIMRDSRYYYNKKEREFYTNIPNIIKSMGANFVGNPYDYMYDKSLYFNTNFHLIDSARDNRTKKMILDLKQSGLIRYRY